MLALLLLSFLLLRNRRAKQVSLTLFTLLFFLFTNPFISNELMLWWEVPPVPVDNLDQQYEAAIILSGVTATDKQTSDRVNLHKGADRIMHTVQLYKLGKVKRIIVSGGSGKLLTEDEPTEAEQIKKILLISGVSENDIITEDQSRNTHENALFTAKLLKDNNINDEQLLLVTSAFHMRRALACFSKAGLAPQAYSTDFYSSDRSYTPDATIIPSDKALSTWTTLTKEWTGYFMYKVLGYI